MYKYSKSASECVAPLCACVLLKVYASHISNLEWRGAGEARQSVRMQKVVDNFKRRTQRKPMKQMLNVEWLCQIDQELEGLIGKADEKHLLNTEIKNACMLGVHSCICLFMWTSCSPCKFIL